MTQLVKELLQLARHSHDAKESPKAALKVLKDHIASKQPPEKTADEGALPSDPPQRAI